jgi:hypothetical protein
LAEAHGQAGGFRWSITIRIGIGFSYEERRGAGSAFWFAAENPPAA